MNELEVTIRGGFPLIVKYRIYPAEPDVGIFGNQIEIDEILTVRGQPADFLKITEKEEEEIVADIDIHHMQNSW